MLVLAARLIERDGYFNTESIRAESIDPTGNRTGIPLREAHRERWFIRLPGPIDEARYGLSPEGRQALDELEANAA